MIRRVLPQLSTSGLWRGAYRYPESAVTAEGPPAEVSFTMCLNEHFWGGIEGTVTEDPAGGFPERGRIEGRAGLREIQLFKRMPVLRFSKGDGTITFNDWVELTYGPAYVDEQLEHPVIHLGGRLSRWRGEMRGSWLMPAWALGADADPSWRLDFPEQSGEWSAVRLPATRTGCHAGGSFSATLNGETQGCGLRRERSHDQAFESGRKHPRRG